MNLKLPKGFGSAGNLEKKGMAKKLKNKKTSKSENVTY